MHTLSNRSLMACASVAALLCVLGFYSLLSAAPAGKPPFEDAAVQREEMIRELRDIKVMCAVGNFQIVSY